MRIGACQPPEILGDIDRSIACIEAFAAERGDVDLLLFPECFLQGYLVEPGHLRDTAIDLASRAFQDVARAGIRRNRASRYEVLQHRSCCARGSS